MANELELVKQKPKNLLRVDNAKELAVAVQKLALAKNIVIAPGMLKVWEECLLEDESKHIFYFSDFLEGIKSMIRKPIYNRLDYADVYKEASEISYKRRIRGIVNCPFCRKPYLSMLDVLKRLYINCSCGKNADEISIEILTKEENLPLWDRFKEEKA